MKSRKHEFRVIGLTILSLLKYSLRFVFRFLAWAFFCGVFVALEGVDLVAEDGGAFELEFLGCVEHFGFEFGKDGGPVEVTVGFTDADGIRCGG